MRNNFFDNIDIDEKLFNELKEEYKKLSTVDREDVLKTTNSMVDGICSILGVKDSEKYHITDEQFNDVAETCKERCNEIKDTCKKLKEQCSDKLSNINREEAIAKANNVIESTLKTFGVKDVEKFLIDPNDEDLKITVATYGDPDDLTCSDMSGLRCFNESCDTCDGACCNEECECTECKCYDDKDKDLEDRDADNGVDSPVKSNIPRINLNLSSRNKKNNTNTESSKEPCAQEHKDGNTFIPTKPYNTESNNVKMNKPCLSEIKKRLQAEAKQVVDDSNSTMIKLFKETLVTKITCILEDDKTHNYVIHPKTEKTPSAVEVTLEDITSNIRNNVYILAEIESELKTLYDFPEVHINVTDTDDADFVNLTVFMVLE